MLYFCDETASKAKQGPNNRANSQARSKMLNDEFEVDSVAMACVKGTRAPLYTCNASELKAGEVCCLTEVTIKVKSFNSESTYTRHMEEEHGIILRKKRRMDVDEEDANVEAPQKKKKLTAPRKKKKKEETPKTPESPELVSSDSDYVPPRKIRPETPVLVDSSSEEESDLVMFDPVMFAPGIHAGPCLDSVNSEPYNINSEPHNIVRNVACVLDSCEVTVDSKSSGTSRHRIAEGSAETVESNTSGMPDLGRQLGNTLV